MVGPVSVAMGAGSLRPTKLQHLRREPVHATVHLAVQAYPRESKWYGCSRSHKKSSLSTVNTGREGPVFVPEGHEVQWYKYERNVQA